MGSISRWCYRIGLTCGALAIVSALALLTLNYYLPRSESLQEIVEKTFLILGNAFMWLGIILLIFSIVWLRNSWAALSKSAKVLCVLGLGAGTFVAAYVFYWAVQREPNKQLQRTNRQA
jgi:drug/metabolite transporter (DMT)-like permease